MLPKNTTCHHVRGSSSDQKEASRFVHESYLPKTPTAVNYYRTVQGISRCTRTVPNFTEVAASLKVHHVAEPYQNAPNVAAPNQDLPNITALATPYPGLSKSALPYHIRPNIAASDQPDSLFSVPALDVKASTVLPTTNKNQIHVKQPCDSYA